ncbi:urea ABC transporter ATP-binding protein [Paenibacillus darwinianus]|uniref:Urea ABC transporter ATP-binding protein n=1 Tax=Paenibacillus darwinianus TaxID=1380763 RepID=A0A9W5RZM1_9BACL|nr:urea ABC transporter ATP-binding subunit UrtE [Paenibacillus darwinianus]EXX86358.1 urea ABC transporter ATP-binding protein [Paenibacillus darwinianus]EXX86406.1 urea ABC transporter ATP-binding protein [Paenibacillus darwinianus]EXX91028.1 urea ABC transporter ATP-binding protein [Paenibacillus darwinianus]
MLNADALEVSYGKSRVISGVSLQVGKADKVCLMGRNGVGKTTLLKSLIGLLSPRQGRIQWEGKEITRSRASERSRMGIAYVPQGREIIPMLTVKENLELGAMSHYPKETARLMEEVLDYFPALSEQLDRKGGVLSGGQQQQLAIGRALMSKPKALFLDEPSEGIQPNVVAEIARTLNRVHTEKSLSVFIVEQNLDFAFKIAERFYVMEKGQIVHKGNTGEIPMDTIKKYLTI